MTAAGLARTVLVSTGWTSSFHVHMTAALASFRTVLVGTGWTISHLVITWCCAHGSYFGWL